MYLNLILITFHSIAYTSGYAAYTGSLSWLLQCLIIRLECQGFVISDRLTTPWHSNYTKSIQAAILAGIDMNLSNKESAELRWKPGMQGRGVGVDEGTIHLVTYRTVMHYLNVTFSSSCCYLLIEPHGDLESGDHEIVNNAGQLH
ncbi:hypothetical protein RHMOL_Rhmol11G0003400 [Rhododendron molle]|uniref:Uncharacterized protein n=1 Tax=Rhododendron molle TaxID=49168 RepID=A0ACC0LN47_RHOML|nr:hypothetical protein RHMOL_Rhmol11G0003400 [Rhododendron molle]